MPLRDQRLPFMFEVWDSAGPSETFVLPINPEQHEVTWPPRATVTQTKGGAWQDVFGMGLPSVSIQGTFGYLGTLPGGGAKSESGVQLCGWDLYKKLEKTFLDFYQRFGEDSPKTPPVLRFYNFTDEFHWEVQLEPVRFLRSVQRRHLYLYQIRMTGLRQIDAPGRAGVIEPEPIRAVLETATLLPEEVAWWQTALAGYAWAYEGMSDVINYVGDLQEALVTIQQSVTAFRESASAFIEAPFELVNQAISTVDTVLAAVTSLSDLPDEFVGLMRETKRNLLALRLQRDRFQEPPEPTQVSTDGFPTEILSAALPRTQTDAVSMNDPDTTTFAPGIESGADRPVAEVSATSSDTLRTLAAKYLGDAGEWKRLAFLNDLTYPYELTVGQRVKIPGTTSADALALLSSESADGSEWEARAYGIDEGLSDRLPEVTPTGGPWTQAGLANLAMQLQHRLNTTLGELSELGHPDYGSILPLLIGKVSTDYWMERAKVEAKSCLLKDPRVQAVERLSFTEANGNIFIEGDVVPKNRSSSEHVRLLVA